MQKLCSWTMEVKTFVRNAFRFLHKRKEAAKLQKISNLYWPWVGSKLTGWWAVGPFVSVRKKPAFCEPGNLHSFRAANEKISWWICLRHHYCSGFLTFWPPSDDVDGSVPIAVGALVIPRSRGLIILNNLTTKKHLLAEKENASLHKNDLLYLLDARVFGWAS